MQQTVQTVNPMTGEPLQTYQLVTPNEALLRIQRAHKTYTETWSKLPISERCEYLKKLAKALHAKKNEYARQMTLEMGKPIAQSEGEVEKSAWTAEVYAEKAEEWLAEETAETDAQISYVTYQPLGVILSIMPWNFPFWQVFRFAIPTLVAGNTTVLRHSNVCAGSSKAIEECFANASFPEGVFSSIVTDHEAVSKIIESEIIQGVSFTGSVEAGQVIGELAGRNLKKCVLELGGSDPFIVLEDADVEKAAKVGADARLISGGQSCIAAKRFIVVESVADRFVSAFAKEFEGKKVGDPMNRETDVGPLANQNQVTKLDGQVKEALANGARAVVGGEPRPGAGAFYEPTILEKVNEGMRVMREEVFGPVAPVLRVGTEAEAMKAANHSELGLGASLWTSDAKRAKKLAAEIETGIVFINALVKSDPRMPFGGVKKSGVGRELSKYGLREFVNTKSVNIYNLSV